MNAVSKSSRETGPRTSRSASFWGFWMNQIAGIRIVFGNGVYEKRLTLTFNFLSSLVGLAIVLTALWSLAAGTLRAGQDFQQFGTWFPANSGVPDWLRWPLLIALILIYAAETLGVALLTFLAIASLGAIVGFLFGVPRPISESGPIPAAQAAAPSNPASDNTGAGTAATAIKAESAPTAAGVRPGSAPGWQANTNLRRLYTLRTMPIGGSVALHR